MQATSAPAARVSSTVSTTQVADGFRRLIRPLLPWATAALVLVCLLQFQDSTSQAIGLAALGGPVLLATAIWCQRGGPCLPVLPLLLAVNMLIYGLPFLLFNVVDLPDPFSDLVTLPLFLWPAMLTLGWFLVPASTFRQRPQPSLVSLGNDQQLLPHLLLGAALLITWFFRSEWYWSLLGQGLASALMNPVNTLIILLTLPGGFIGAYRFGRRQLREPQLFWALAVLYFFTYVLSFLLSAAQNLVLSVLLGLWIGRARQALPITLALVLTLAFLHPGKFAMRAKYWGQAVPLPSPPELLLEWVDSSIQQTFNPPEDNKIEGLDKRLSNLAMLIYVQARLQTGTPLLDGATYALIPDLVLPRFLNPSKARTHEGQVILNLHFGRQASREQTETTYIAWGILPEAVGNFGSLFGPLVVGLFFGFIVRVIELRGAAQDLLSKNGLESLVAGVIVIGSFELVSTTLAAALFQILILVELLALVFVGRRSAA